MRAKRIIRLLTICMTFIMVSVGLMSPAFAYNTSAPSPPYSFILPSSGDPVLIGGNYMPSICFTAPNTTDFYSYFSYFEIQYIDSNTNEYKLLRKILQTNTTGTYYVGDTVTYYMPAGTLVRFRVRTVSKTSAASNWVYSSYFKRNTMTNEAPTLSISPDPVEVGNCYENTVHLSWPSSPQDPDGHVIKYQVELGLWDGGQYVYKRLAETAETVFTYDISQSYVGSQVIPELNRGQQFTFRVRATDGIDSSAYSEVTGLHRNSAPNAPTDVRSPIGSVAEGVPVEVDFIPPTDPDGSIDGFEAALMDVDGNWYNGGEVVGTADFPDVTSITIQPGPWSLAGRQWMCFVRAFDSYGVRSEWSGVGSMISVSSAATGPSFPVNDIVSDENGVVSICGAVESSMVSAEVAFNACFVINPNAVGAGARFISPLIRIRNTSPVPVEIHILSCRATGTAPKIVSPDAYTLEQWLKLGSADSKQVIALGLKNDNGGNFWFGNEEQQLGTFSPGEASDFVMQARFGLAWEEQENFKYEMVFEVRLVP